jgi:hypothetical protein
MESNKNLLMNKAMVWGGIVALASMIVTSIFYATDNMFSPAASWISFMVYVGGIILATLSYKKTIEEKTPFPYSKALGLGVATTFFASLILAVFTFVLYKIIDPGLFDKMMVLAEEQLLNYGFSDEMVEQQIDMQRKMMTPAILSLTEVFRVTLNGLIISLITSIFLRKKGGNGYEAAMKEIEGEE